MTEMEEIKMMLADMNKKLDKVIFQNKIALNTKYGLPIKQETHKIDELQKQVNELKQENSILSITVEMHDEVEQQAIKDTAKEILQYVGNLYDDCDQRFRLKDYQWHKNLCKKYGVEVEE